MPYLSNSYFYLISTFFLEYIVVVKSYQMDLYDEMVNFYWKDMMRLKTKETNVILNCMSINI